MILQAIPHSIGTHALLPTPSPQIFSSSSSAASVSGCQHCTEVLGRLRGLGGFRGGHSCEARKAIGLPNWIREEGCNRKLKRGLITRFGDGLGLGGLGFYATLKEEDLLRKTQQPRGSSSSSSGGGGGSSGGGARADAVSGMEGKSLWSKMSQNVNVSGVSFSARVIVKDRHLAIPHVSVPDISWVDWKALRSRGFEGVLFDKDNTLTAPFEQSIWPSLTASLEECKDVFGGRIALLSNSAGLYQYDPEGAEAKSLENRLGIPVIRHGQKKPAGNALAVSNYFGCDPSLLIMVGDRYFTDVVYGNSNGLLTIRTAPLTTRGEPFVVKRVRGLEETLVNWWRRKGCLPPKHVLFHNPVDFIKDPGCW